ncbi:unnamed protein product [marine sediment metagenome]|uniref:Uncharacterized protein n=1 Tax=marine sediment metagenome TaxID=412755 RepID=X0WU01_9ZZZZ
MSKFYVKFVGVDETAEFADLANAIKFGHRDPKARHFKVIYRIGSIRREVYNTKEVRSA